MRRTLIGLSLGLGAAAVVLLASLAGLLTSAEMDSYDWRIRRAASVDRINTDIVLVEINDTTLRDMDGVLGRWPWPRMAMGMIVDFLAQGGAKVIAIDFAYLEQDKAKHDIGGAEWSGAESDAALVEAVRKAPNTILLADAVDEGLVDGQHFNTPPEWRGVPFRLGPAIEERPAILPPFAALTGAATMLGHNFLALDPDGPARRIVPFVRSGDKYLPSLGVAAALRALDVPPSEVVLDGASIRVSDRRLPLVPVKVRNPGATTWRDQWTLLINYQAPEPTNERPAYPAYEARHLLYSAEQIAAGETPLVDPAEFKGKIVFVGLTASGLVDVFTTPFGGRMPGIQLHASVTDSILSNRFIRPATSGWRLLATLAAGVVVGLLTVFLPFAAAAPAALVPAAGWVLYAQAAFAGGLWVSMAEPLAAMAVALFAGTAYQYFVEGYQKRVVKKLFGRYVSRDVYDQLLKHPERAELGGNRRHMTVLFSDIRGFTSVTEKGDPEQLVAQLNEYFSRMVAVVFRNKGTVDKFVGDMVMALFGAPLDDVDHAEHAVAAACEMVRELGELNRRWAAEGRPALDIGVGVNSGDMIAGNIGSSSIMSYTVIGDNVNLGSRLESLNKDYRTRIIISDATRALLKGEYAIRPLGDVVVKGKSRPVAIFEVRTPSPLPTAHEEVHT